MVQSPAFWMALAGAVLLFWILPPRARFGGLGLISIAYLMTIEPATVLVYMAWAILFFFLAPRVFSPNPLAKRITAMLVLAILAYLAHFKYIPRFIAAFSANPVERNIIIPLGISYISFKLIHYAVEVGKGNIPNRSLSQFLCWLFLFPTFTAGPIERFDHFLAEQFSSFKLDHIVHGATRIIHGIVKKFFIGELLLKPMFREVDIEKLLDMLTKQPSYKIWGFLVLSYLYAYVDFSAYSDIAIGASRMFGIKIMENFRFPIFASSIGDFWKRWHMTLARWCQAYVYMPMLGLTRNPYLAVYATFTVIGLWHAGSLNYLGWGWYHGTGVVVFLSWNRFLRRRKITRLGDNVPYRFVSTAATFMFVAGSFSFTITHDHGGIGAAVRILAKLFFIDMS